MPQPDDLSDPSRSVRGMQKRIERINPYTGDPTHRGSGADSIQIGPGADASGAYSVALGTGAWSDGQSAAAVGEYASALGYCAAAFGASAQAYGMQSAAIGFGSNASGFRSVALGWEAEASADYEIMLGTSGHTVVVPGTFSNPSARRLKRCITPAPVLRDVFAPRYEWEYKKDRKRRRHIGPMADDLLGTEAERFVTFDAKGRVAGIETLGLHGAQIAALHAENTELRAEVDALRDIVTEMRAELNALKND